MPLEPAALILFLSELIESYTGLIAAGERGIRAHQEFLEAARLARTSMVRLRTELLAHMPSTSRES